jgi:hypothetical protein
MLRLMIASQPARGTIPPNPIGDESGASSRRPMAAGLLGRSGANLSQRFVFK